MKATLISAVLLLTMGTAVAEELSDKQEQIIAGRQSADMDPKTGFAGSGILISGDTDSSTASLSLSRGWDASTDTLDFQTVGAKLSAPLAKGTKSGDFLTDAGFSDSSSLELSYGMAFAKDYAVPATPRRRHQLLQKGREECARAEEDSQKKAACAKAQYSQVKKYLTRDEQDELADTQFQSEPIWNVAVSGAIGYNKFDYRDKSDLSKQKTTRTPFSFSVSGGWSPDSRPIFFSAGYQYKRDYKDADQQTFCPAATSGPVECFTSPFDLPTKKTTSSIFVLSRVQWQLALDKDVEIPIGLELQGAYDAEHSVWGTSGTLYLFSDSKQNLRGGIKGSWEQKDGAKVGVFVGSGFSLF